MAGRIRDEDIALVRQRTNVAEVVGEQVTLRSAGGGSLKGLCPFHDEKTPSFNVRPQLGYWKCFGCGEGGDVIDFLVKLDHLTFAEAVERLATRAGVQLRYEEGGVSPRAQQGLRTRLVEAHRVAAEFYAEQLGTAEAADGRRFLDDRGFDAGAVTRFGVGYAPASWDTLVRHLRGRGFTDKELLAAGLASEGRHGPIDRFRGRLMWPIRDIAGDVVGFGARRLREEDPGSGSAPKYLNTAETPIYRKSQVLYGVDLAKRDIARRMQAVVVEGYTDVMACHLAGVTTAVATCGTAFGAEHIKVLRRLLMDQNEFRGEVVFTFDGDEAGQKAALRAFEDDQKFVTQTFVAVEPTGLDPCDLRLMKGDEAVRELVARRVPLFEFAVRSTLDRHNLDIPEGRVAALRQAVPLVARIRDVALRDDYARLLAGWVGVPEPNEVVVRVRAESRGGTGGRSRGAAAGATGAAAAAGAAAPPGGVVGAGGADRGDPAFQVEREVLKVAIQHPVLAGPAFDALDPGVFTAPPYAAVRGAIAAAGGLATVGGGPAWVERVLTHCPDDAARALVTALAVESLLTRAEPDARYAGTLLARIEELHATRQIAELKSRVQRVNPVEQPEEYNRLFGRLVALEQYRRVLRERAIGEIPV